MLVTLAWYPSIHYTETCARRADVGNIRLLSFKESVYEGVVQICNIYQQVQQLSRIQVFTWDYVTTINWNDTVAQVVCRQLNFPHSSEIALVRLQDCTHSQFSND